MQIILNQYMKMVMINLILGIILCMIVMKYNQEIVQFLIVSGNIDSLITYLHSLKETKLILKFLVHIVVVQKDLSMFSHTTNV